MIPIHPRIVHFPVAFLIAAAIFGILANRANQIGIGPE